MRSQDTFLLLAKVIFRQLSLHNRTNMWTFIDVAQNQLDTLNTLKHIYLTDAYPKMTYNMCIKPHKHD